MWEFKIYSRGGQGAVTAAKILVEAAMLDGKFGQAIPSYGQERKGAPVFTYARIADSEIEVKSYVYRPNCVVCFDTGLADLGFNFAEGVRPNGVLVVNTDEPYADEAFEKIVALDADKITHELLGEVPPNTVMLGALARATGCVTIESLKTAIKKKMPGKAGELNAEACRAAYGND